MLTMKFKSNLFLTEIPTPVLEEIRKISLSKKL